MPLLAVAALAAAPVQAQPVPDDRSKTQKSDWELEQEKRDWKEGDVKLPAYPEPERLIEFFVSSATSFRFFIDPQSLVVARDGVVRYTLIARSQTGVANVSYEGIRCTTNSVKLYALGNDGRWTPKESEWRTIEPRTVQRWHIELRSVYFCPGNSPIFTAAEGVSALRRGGHPLVTDRVGVGRN